MSKFVESVEVTFDNLDYVIIPVEYFGAFSINGIRCGISRVASNATLQRTEAEQIEFDLLQSVDVALPNMIHDLSFAPAEKPSLLERIVQRRDITDLTVHYSDNSTKQICVPWEDAENEYHNKLQQAQMNGENNLNVTISR